MEHQKIQIPPWLHSTFKDLSNEYSHAQIRAKTKKLWLRQVGEKKLAAVRKVCRDMGKYVATSNSMSRHRDRCRDKQQYVATSTTSVATSSSMSRHRRPVSRQESFVATRNLCRDQKRCRSQKKPKFDIFDQISSPFHPRTIYILVF